MCVVQPASVALSSDQVRDSGPDARVLCSGAAVFPVLLLVLDGTDGVVRAGLSGHLAASHRIPQPRPLPVAPAADEQRRAACQVCMHRATVAFLQRVGSMAIPFSRFEASSSASADRLA